jgi:hypothetical protein
MAATPGVCRVGVEREPRVEGNGMSRLVGNIGIRLAFVGILAVGGILFRDRLSSDPNDLRVGDCFQTPTAMGRIQDVQHQPCSEAHDSEVIFASENPAPKGAPVLSDDQHQAWVEINCLPAFSAYTGLDLLSQEVLDVGYMVPTNDSWKDGDRKVICYVARLDGTVMSQSVRTAH